MERESQNRLHVETATRFDNNGKRNEVLVYAGRIFSEIPQKNKQTDKAKKW